VTSTTCDAQGPYCVGSRGDLIAWAKDWQLILSSTILLAALFAWVCANNIADWLARYWSFEARFTRRLNPQSIVVAYQPLVDLKTDDIVGVEVLARWRDVDGTLVAPSRFIDIVARSGRTGEFTQMVVDRAYAELSEHIGRDTPLEVSFNVFASDFDSAGLLKTFGNFLGEPQRFRPAVELVENHDIDYESAQCTIEALAAAGVRTFIDDFGTGYSSIERVARLAVHGVKLDRSFAMSPPDSVMGRMLVQVIEIIKTTGRLIIVEGVETLARLNVLRATGLVDYVQGYVISRPLDINELTALLARGKRRGRSVRLPRRSALVQRRSGRRREHRLGEFDRIALAGLEGGRQLGGQFVHRQHDIAPGREAERRVDGFLENGEIVGAYQRGEHVASAAPCCCIAKTDTARFEFRCGRRLRHKRHERAYRRSCGYRVTGSARRRWTKRKS
jgi:EAL domain-containing protein (putative c-di-GMP-specific phosphodiesterase class I)